MENIINNNEIKIEEVKSEGKAVRKSGIELLKIIALLLIVLSHVCQELEGGTVDSSLIGDWVVNFSLPGSGITNLIISILRYSGLIGDIIFIVCSSWFLLDKSISNKKKLLRIFIDVFVINVLFFIIVGAIVGYDNISIKNTIKSFMPNYFANNWYLTCYFVFALITPLINIIINSFSKEVHFVVSLTLFTLFFICGFVVETAGSFNCSITHWIAIYFIVSYLKKYGISFCNSVKINISLVLVGILGIVACVIATYYLGTKISLLNSTLRWNKINSPFALCLSIGLFNLFNRCSFKSKFVNYISSLSFIIYITHSNLILREYLRPNIWNYIYTNFGYNYILGWIALYTISLFIVAIIVSSIYNVSLQKLVHKLSDKVYQLLVKLVNWCQTKLIKIIK